MSVAAAWVAAVEVLGGDGPAAGHSAAATSASTPSVAAAQRRRATQPAIHADASAASAPTP